MKQRPLLSFCNPGVQVFEKFLAGDTLQDCYAAVAAVANRWLDMLDTQVCLKQRKGAAPSANLPAPLGQWALLTRAAGQRRHFGTTVAIFVGTRVVQASQVYLTLQQSAPGSCAEISLHYAMSQGASLTSFGCRFAVLLWRMPSPCAGQQNAMPLAWGG